MELEECSGGRGKDRKRELDCGGGHGERRRQERATATLGGFYSLPTLSCGSVAFATKACGCPTAVQGQLAAQVPWQQRRSSRTVRWHAAGAWRWRRRFWLDGLQLGATHGAANGVSRAPVCCRDRGTDVGAIANGGGGAADVATSRSRAQWHFDQTQVPLTVSPKSITVLQKLQKAKL